nr:hypothetical protein [Salinibacterium sp. M195]
MKKLLVGIACVALTSGALLGVAAPTFADEIAVPENSSDAAASSRAPEISSHFVVKMVWVCQFTSRDNSPTGYVLHDGPQPANLILDDLGKDVSRTADFATARELNASHPSFIVADDDVALCAFPAETVDDDVVPGEAETSELVMPAVTFAQSSCRVAGSYSLGVAPGFDPALITFTVNGVSGVLAGTYPVDASGVVAVTAQAVQPNGLEFAWVDPPAFGFVIPDDGECAEVGSHGLATASGDLPTLALEAPTLAYTGDEGVAPVWWLLPAGMILLGAAAIAVRRRAHAEVS